MFGAKNEWVRGEILKPPDFPLNFRFHIHFRLEIFLMGKVKAIKILKNFVYFFVK